MRFCTSIFLYWEELCSNNAKYIFGVCFTLLRHTFLYNENPAIVAWLKRGLPMSLEKKAPIV